MSLNKATSVVAPMLAAAMLVLTAIPAEVWKAPLDDQMYTGFDPNLVYATAGGGAVRVSTDSIDVIATPSSQPSVNLATTLMPKLEAAVDVFMMDNGGARQPFWVGFWSPWTTTGQFVMFGPPPQNLITAQTVTKGEAGATLVGGSLTASTPLGHYEVNATYHVALSLDKSKDVITTQVTAMDGTTAKASVSSALFGNVQVALTASAFPGTGTSHVVLRNFSVVIPHQRFWASKVADPKATVLLVLMAIAGIALLGIAVLTNLTLRAPTISLNPARRVLFAVAGAVVVYLVGNALLFPLGGHPFDMGAEKLYAYVAPTYGLAQLYFLPNIVSLAWIWNGQPFVESAFPYEAVSAYLHTTIGWLSGLLFGSIGPRSPQVQYLTESINVVFGMADAALIYLILQHIGTGKRWSVVASALFLFNPAVWFSMSVWGQTHVFSLFFVLACVLLIERRQVTLAWLGLAAACLTRPQMLVFGLLLGIVLLRKFSWRENLAAVSWTVIAAFVALTPFTLATSPSLPIDVMLHNFRVQEGGGNVSTLTTVSQDSYSIWPLITYLLRGASSLQRAFTPSSEAMFGSVTYQLAGQVLTVTAMLIVAGALAIKKKAVDEPGAYFPYVALGITSFLMLLTGIVSTHFLLALPFLLLCRRWMGDVAYFYVIAIWTITTFVPMYGDMGVVLSSHDYPLLARSHNTITRFFVDLYSWDRFITVGVVANICALIWIGVKTFRPQKLSLVNP